MTAEKDIGERLLENISKFCKKLFREFFNSEKKNVFDFGRDVFAQEVASKIIETHNKTTASFIFGISAYWGEGKTFLLEKIQVKLEESGFKVIWFNPWKYSGDKLSLMRRFVRILNDSLPFFLRINLDDFDRDRTFVKISYIRLIFYSLIGYVIFLLYTLYVQPFNSYFPTFSAFWILIIIPILVAILQKVITLQQDEKAVSTVEQFDSKVNRILLIHKILRNKVVIFVDDLDRVKKEEAQNVLDSLRTFFDKPSLSYVVTGDNKVLEPAVATPSEDGRRFLKKIFNIYWRMPLPSMSQIKSFIKDRLKDSPFNEEEEKIFAKWMLDYFDLNPRNIERFIETLVFNINSLKKQLQELNNSSADERLKNQIQDVLDNKLLLTRALILQEKAYSFYEKIIAKPSIITDIEKAIDGGNNDFGSYFNDLPPEQTLFLGQFLTEMPRFYQDGGLKVNLVPFFKLTADISLSDERGISTEAFVRFLENGDNTKIKQWLDISSDVKPLVESAKSRIEAEPDLNTIIRLLGNLLNSIDGNSKKYEFIKAISPDTINKIKDVDTPEQNDVFKKYLNMFEVVDKEEAGSILTNITFTRPENFNLITEKLNKNSNRVALNWIKSYFSQNRSDTLAKIEDKQEYILPDSDFDFNNEIDSVVNDFINMSPIDRENTLLFLNLTRDGLKKLKSKILEQYSSLGPDVKQQINELIIFNFGNKTWGEKRIEKWLNAS